MTALQLNQSFCLLAVNNSNQSHFKKLRLVGRGHFGCVSLCKLKREKSYGRKGSLVAVKHYRNSLCEVNARKEAIVMCNLDHPNLVKYLDHFTTAGGRTMIVMEFCDSGTLEDYMFSCPRPHHEKNVWRFTWQMSGALTYLHQQQILHNDLKPTNILCKTNPDGTIDIKIADFGVCNLLDRETRDYAYNVKVSH